jgi:conflict system STAND superfamily ATPase
MSDSPFVGPRPFEKEESDRFFGRTRETEELLSLIIAHRAVLVYAQSGAGKSSLLRAGVIHRLEEQQYQVLRSARVHGLLPNDLPPETVQNVFVFHAIQYWAAKLSDGQSIKDHAKTTLSGFLKPLVVPSGAGEDCPPPLIVIFDQFEEFFTTNQHRWEERRPFFDQLAQALHDLPTMKVVFVMREEYIAQLEPFSELLPEKLRPRMHLERLRGNSARNAVVKPFQKRGLSFDANAADELMKELSEIRVAEGDKFRETHGEFVEPVQLQVVCQSLWENLPAGWKSGPNASSDGSRLITAEYIERFGDVDHALARYYDRSVERAAAASEGKIGEGELRRWFKTALITPTGTRGLAFRGAPGATWRIPGLALKELEEAHVIRREDRSGTITHELTHDRFIEPIQKSNHKWLAGYQDAERVRAKLEEYAKRESDELLDEVELREAEEYLNSPVAKILGATPEARLLVTRSRKQVEEAKKRQTEELEEARRRAEEQEKLRKVESERVKLLLEKRKRERIFGVTVFLLGIIMLIALAALSLVSYRAWRLSKQKAADLEAQRQALVERGESLRENAKSVLANGTDNPIKDVAALRNLALALNCNPADTEAARLASNLLLQHVWCPPAASAVTYQKDALLAATFVQGSNNEIFAVSGDGQLLLWNGRELSHFRYLFEKPQQDLQHVVQPGSASFSLDGLWLFIIPPTLISAANAEAPGQGGPQQGVVPPSAGSGHEPCKLQIWRWSMQKRTYESAGEDLEISRLRGSRMNFAWSNESDRLVIVNARGSNEAECAFFEQEGKTFRELVDRSNELNRMKVVALAFAKYRSGFAAVSVDSEAPALRKVGLFSFSGEYLERFPVSGKDSILLSEGFLPNGIAFGPGNDEITLTSWNSVRILDLRDGKVTPVPPPTFRDQFMRLVVGPGDVATRLVATSLYGRVHVAKGANRQEPAEPVVYRGSIGIPQFSSDGQRLLILSGAMFNLFDSVRLIDVSPLYRPREAAPEKVEEKPAPPWLAEIASAVSASDPSQDGSLTTLEDVRKKYPGSKAGDPYEAVWKRFFPDDRTK